MNIAYLKLGFAAFLPVIFSGILYFLDKKTSFGKLNNKIKQVVYGIVFGALAIVGTEWGIQLESVVVNCRDAAVIVGGLMFGSPAGIIAGIIGGIERWVWGAGDFTRFACSLSTVIAGIYAALLRKFMFENKKPGWLISFAIGVVIEVFHLTMVFITNMDEPIKAMSIVKLCAVPMIVASGFSVMLSSVFLNIISRKRFSRSGENVHISQTIQRWLLVTVVLAFVATSGFVYNLQNEIAASQIDSSLSIAIEDIADDISETSDKNLIKITNRIINECRNMSIKDIAEKYGIAEINIVNSKGIIVESTNDDFVNFDMHSGPQSSAFLCLLADTYSYVQKYGPISFDENISRKYAGVKIDDGFVQVGYDAENFQKDIDDKIVDIANHRHVGKTGYVLIFDGNNNIVSATANINTTDIKDSIKNTEFPDEGITFTMTIGDELCYSRYITTEGYHIASVLPESEAMQIRNICLYVNAFMEILVFAILFALIYLLIKRVVVNQIKNINASLCKITNGDLNEVVNVRSSEEFASLSDDINSTVGTLKKYIAEASARIDRELEFARTIQISALPSVEHAFPVKDGFDIFATMNTAKEVGGDFYDFYITEGNKLHFLIADVSGKGIPAAMFMMRAKTELRRATEDGLPLGEAFTQSNKDLCDGNDAGMFVTAWQGSIDLLTGDVQFANAGHNPPLIKRSGRRFEYLKSRAGFVLAGMEGLKYKSQQMKLQPGDIIYLYTDGVTEATNSEQTLYGEDRLLDTVNSKEFESMEELCRFVKKDVDKFVNDAPQFDDITMVAFKYLGVPGEGMTTDTKPEI